MPFAVWSIKGPSSSHLACCDLACSAVNGSQSSRFRYGRRSQPFVLETAVDGYADTHRTIIEKVALNPRVDDARFVKPKA